MDLAILKGKKVHVLLPHEMKTWGDTLEKSNRKVRLTRLRNGTRISTVFLGLDHSFGNGTPLWFETMIFSDQQDLDGYQARHATWEDAVRGHNQATKYAREKFAGRFMGLNTDLHQIFKL